MLWDICKAAIGALFSSIFGGWLEKRRIATAAAQKAKDDAAWNIIRDEQLAIRNRDAVENLPSSGPDSAVAKLHREYSRPS